ncbi:MAG TPA: DUF2721 domain-containing protein [Candidatus Krumholzibacteria bacterium]
MESQTGIAAVGHVIQLSLSPVFLLLGIGSMLSVMTNRLARIVDRARASEAHFKDVAPEEVGFHTDHLSTLSIRAKLINRAITFCTFTALLICAVVAMMFLSAFLEFDASLVVALLFVMAMGSFFTGLVFFLREIFIATAALRIGPK